MLEKKILEARKYLQASFGLEVRDTQLRAYSSEQWKLFVTHNQGTIDNLTKESEALFIPQSQIAYVRTNTPFLIPNAFHEVFGHGMYCENSLPGKELVQQARKGNGQQHINAQRNQESRGLFNIHRDDYEGFAVWMEGTLSNETRTPWEAKLESPTHHAYWNYMSNAEERLTRKGLLAQMGFTLNFTDAEITDVIKALYGKEFGSVHTVLVTGSENPETDLDLYVVREGPRRIVKTGWLDITEVPTSTISELVRLHDTETVASYCGGRAVYDPQHNVPIIRAQISTQDITQESIDHNLRLANEMESFLDRLTEHNRTLTEKYIHSYRAQARALSQRRVLTTPEETTQDYIPRPTTLAG